MSAPRVALLTSSVSRQAGGVFDAVRYLALALRGGSGCPVEVFGLRDGDTDADSSAWREIPVRAFNVAGPAAFGYAPGFDSALEASDPSVVHVHGLWMYPSLAASQWALHRKVTATRPCVVSPHGMLHPWALQNSHWKKRLAGMLYENRHLRRAACLHALNPAEAEAFRAYDLKNPVSVIPNGVEIPSAPTTMHAPWRDTLGPDARVLLYIGRLHQIKGLDTLLKAWAVAVTKAASAGWHLAIAGWGQHGYEQELKTLAAAHGLGERVHFLGPQYGEAKAACLQAANAFILPSLSEGHPMAVLEAWAHALPVVMTAQCNLPAGFETGAALPVEPSVESLAAGLEQLFAMNDPALAAMGERGLALVRERYQWSSIAAQMNAVYQWTLGDGPKPSCIVN